MKILLLRPPPLLVHAARCRNWPALWLIVCLALTPPAQAQTSPQVPITRDTLPSLGDGADMTVAAERRLGDRIAVSIYRDPDVVDDAILGDYVNSLWQPLRAAARSRGELNPELDERFSWEIFLLRDRTVNAFALPGGYFGLNLGLIATVSTTDELAAVLAHELSHVTQRHISRLMTQQSRQAPWLIAAMIVGALAAGKNANLGSAAIIGGQAVAVQGQLNFSRDMEREADRVGYGVMTGAGFDSRGVTGVFEKLQRGSKLNDSGAFPYLRSHPLTTERIAEAQSRLQLAEPSQSPRGTGYAQMLHAMMSARARVLAVSGADALRPVLTEGQQRSQAAAPPGMVVSAAASGDAGAIYGAALSAARLREFETANNLLAKLRPLAAGDERTRQAVVLLTIETDLQAGKIPVLGAGYDLEQALSRADLLVHSRALLAAGQAQPVIGRLQNWVSSHPRDAGAWQLLATAHGNLNQTVRAIRADAESRAAQLDYSAALDRMRAAQSMIRAVPGSADHIESSIVDTRARQIAALLKDQLLQEKGDR